MPHEGAFVFLAEREGVFHDPFLGEATYFDQNPGGFAAGFFVLQTRRSKLRSFGKQKTHENSWVLILSGGERGIRTPGPVTVNGFQDRRIRPLCHLSAAKVKHRNR